MATATEIVTDDDANESLQWLGDHMAECVKARADYDHLEEFSKTVLAELRMNECQGMAVNQAEAYCRAHQKYRDHRKLVDAANRARLKMDYQRRFHELRLELWRTACANARSIQ